MGGWHGRPAPPDDPVWPGGRGQGAAVGPDHRGPGDPAARALRGCLDGPGSHPLAAEQWIKEGGIAIKWTRLSCRKFRYSEVRLQLHAMAYNLANFMRMLALPKEVEHLSLTTIREKLVKTRAKMVAHGRYVTFQMAEVAVPRDLIRKFLQLIDELRGSLPAPA